MKNISTDLHSLREEKKDYNAKFHFMSFDGYKFHNLEDAIKDFTEDNLNKLVQYCIDYAVNNTFNDELYALLNEDYGFVFYDKDDSFHFTLSLTHIHRKNELLMSDIEKYISIMNDIKKNNVIEYESELLNRFEDFCGIQDNKIVDCNTILRCIASNHQQPIEDYKPIF